MKAYNRQISEVVQTLQSDVEKGLGTARIADLQVKYGENALRSKKKKTIGRMILEQFKDFMVQLLIVAAIISIALGDVFEGAVILGIVVLNAVLGVYQENKASNALDALKSMAAPKAKVIRNQQVELISSKQLVPGDIVILESGDYIPADLRIVEAINLKIDESALTGESVAVEKDNRVIEDQEVALADRKNCAYMSTIVTYGRGKGIVVMTGMDTEIGHIATLLDEQEDEQTPLQQNLAKFGKTLAIVSVLICLIIFGIGVLRGDDVFDMFMTSVSLAVAAIPEGLPAVVTVVLAMGMQRMVKKHSIMKRLSAVETLGSTSTICTDKTGTLTQNKMMVKKIFNGEQEWEVNGSGYSGQGELKLLTEKEPELAISLERLMQAAVLCNDAKIAEDEVIGDPTEGALLAMAQKAGYDQSRLNQEHARIKEYPFDSERKLMSTLHPIDGQHIMLTKGAADELLTRCVSININGQEQPLTYELKNKIIAKNNQYADSALRVLGYAYKKVAPDSNLEQEENQLIFSGISGMIDPPRVEVKQAIKLCKSAGIRVVMITGDHITTAAAIAREIGILDAHGQAIEGAKLNQMTDQELMELVKHTNVFARVSPEHKVRIVTAMKANGEVAAMTGDGVNDAPALKKADIGIAMGITGTDVSKEAADMILTDDNFSSIVAAVEEGRIIYSNIRKFVGFLLSCNIGEILIIFTAILLRWPIPLLPIQLLWVNLITDSFPAFALGLEKGELQIMNNPPRRKEEPIVDRKMKIAIIVQSIGLALATLISFRIGYSIGGNDLEMATTLGRTFCFVTLIFGEMLRAYSARSEIKPITQLKIFSNRFLNISVLIAIGLVLLVVYIPFIAKVFGVMPIALMLLGIPAGLGLIPTLFSEAGKKMKQQTGQ